jgi:transposase
MQTKEIENEIRKQRGMEIAKTSRIMRREKGGYVVPSQSGAGAYIVEKSQAGTLMCECPDFDHVHTLGVKCKHIWAVEMTIDKKIHPDGTVEYTVKKTYPQNWSAYNKAQTHEEETLMKLLSDMTKGISEPYVFGRPSLNLGETIFCSALKIYSTLSSRRTMANYRTALEKGYIIKVPNFNAVSELLNRKDITPILLELIETSSLPLKSVENDFAIDSSGFSTCRYARWYDFKYGKEVEKRVWLKAHLVCGVKTNIVTAAKVTQAYSHDTKELPELIERTAKTFTIKEVSADKAYSSRDNIRLINGLGATPYIPFKDNTTGNARGSMLWVKMYHFFMCNRDEFLQQYHKRSNSETTFHMLKAKFGSAVRSKNTTAQINEILLKVLCHNICVVIQEMHELGIEAKFNLKGDGRNE